MYLKKIDLSKFSWVKLSQVTTAHVAEFLREVEQLSGASSATLLRSRLSDVYRMAETEGLIASGRNPVSATYAPDREVLRERLTLEQFWLIHARASPWMQRAMCLALVTGQRRDDLANLKFSAFKDGFLHIEQGKSGGTTRLRLNGNIRLNAVNMSISEAVSKCRDLIITRYMIHHVEHTGSAKPGDPITSNGISNAFRMTRNAVGITAAAGRTPPSFHEIRSLSERLYREQYGADFAQAMLGHKHASMTAKYDDMRGQGWQEVSVK